MAILLEGLNIPEGNPITINIYRDGTWVNAYTTKDGKAIPVPEPHGDLIDRKALLEGEGRYLISLCKEGIDVEEILRAKTVIPASKED